MRRSTPPTGSPDGAGPVAADVELEQPAEIVTQQAGIVTYADTAAVELAGNAVRFG